MRLNRFLTSGTISLKHYLRAFYTLLPLSCFFKDNPLRMQAYSYAGQGYSSPMRLRAKGMTHAGACCLDSRSRMYSMYGSTWRK